MQLVAGGKLAGVVLCSHIPVSIGVSTVFLFIDGTAEFIT